MRHKYQAFLPLVVLLAGLAAGCSGDQSENEAPAPPAVINTGLKTSQWAGSVVVYYPVTKPTLGKTVFQATVVKGTMPTTKGTVSLVLTNPGAHLTLPAIPMKVTGNHYEGTANLTKPGDWEAKTTVIFNGQSGTSTHTFKVS